MNSPTGSPPRKGPRIPPRARGRRTSGSRVVRRTVTVDSEVDARVLAAMEREDRHYSTIVGRALRAYLGLRSAS